MPIQRNSQANWGRVDFKNRDVTASVYFRHQAITDKDSFAFRAHGGTGKRTVELGQENGRSVVILKSNGTPANRFVEVHTIFPTSDATQYQCRQSEYEGRKLNL